MKKSYKIDVDCARAPSWSSAACLRIIVSMIRGLFLCKARKDSIRPAAVIRQEDPQCKNLRVLRKKSLDNI